MDKLPRGIRNHNPGNIRKSAERWKGIMEFDAEYCQFSSPQYGIRAMARILLNYEKRYHLHTINEIIVCWAPPEDGNATSIYADYVARKMNIERDQVMDIKAHLVGLIKAMIEFENGMQPYDCETLTMGIAMALGDDL